MIQDIYPDCLNNSFCYQQPSPSDAVLSFRDSRLSVTYSPESQELLFPHPADFPADDRYQYLFSVSSVRFFLNLTSFSPVSSFESYSMQDLRKLSLGSNTGIFAAYTGFHLWTWMQHNKFCGACGHPTEIDRSERAMVCPACGNRIYPRINPAVIVAVKNGDKLLLTRYKTGFAHNALIAGFTEIGETVEETVHREVMEEVGLKVKNLQYYKSQPWGIASDLLIGFYCDVDGDDTIRRDDRELKYAAWVPRAEIVLQPSDYSLTNEMMNCFRQGKK